MENGRGADSASAAPRRRPQKSSHAHRRAASRPRERVLWSAQPAPTQDGRRARALAPTSSPGPATASLGSCAQTRDACLPSPPAAQQLSCGEISPELSLVVCGVIASACMCGLSRHAAGTTVGSTPCNLTSYPGWYKREGAASIRCRIMVSTTRPWRARPARPHSCRACGCSNESEPLVDQRPTAPSPPPAQPDSTGATVAVAGAAAAAIGLLAALSTFSLTA